ncbi:MAG: putative sulfate exporter family transporter [Pseudomonadota bacterium]
MANPPLRPGVIAAGAFEAAARRAPGLILCACLAMAAILAGAASPVPAMLYALIFGMAAHPLLERPGWEASLAPGVESGAREVLRLGVILLGAGVTAAQIVDLGPGAGLTAVAALVFTLVFGTLLARACGLSAPHAVLSAGATAICGASAALAIAAVIPRDKEHERNVILTVAGVTALSTLCMIAYPAIAGWAGFDDRQAGVFFGAAIHDVAQVMGAGFIVSADAAETAGVTKLVRVALLAGAVIAVAAWFKTHREAEAAGARAAPLPYFLIGFVALVAINSLGWLPAPVQTAFQAASKFCLVTAVVALGCKAAPRALVAAGPRPLLALVLQTTLIAIIAFFGAMFFV